MVAVLKLARADKSLSELQLLVYLISEDIKEHWRMVLGHWSTLEHWRTVLGHWRTALEQWGTLEPWRTLEH